MTTTAHPSWLVDSDYDVDAFRELVSRKTDHADVPNAVTIERNVPVYDGEALHDIARDPVRRRDLLGELAWVLGQGPGVLAVQRGLTEENRLSERKVVESTIAKNGIEKKLEQLIASLQGQEKQIRDLGKTVNPQTQVLPE